MGKKFTESKIFNIILSILIALGLWAYVTASVTDVGESTVRSIPVTVVGEEALNAKGLMIDPNTKLTVSARVSGNRSLLVSMASNPSEYFSATINVAEITEPGTYDLSCTITPEFTSLTSTGVRVMDQEGKTIQVTVTRLMSKTVEVRGVFKGTVDEDNNYRANPVEVTPGTIKVQGPESLVNQVEYAQVTITGDNLTKTYTGELGFQLMTADGEVVDDDDLTTNVNTVSVVMPVVKTMEVPLSVEYVYGGGITEDNFERYVTVDIQPSTIQVSGDEVDVSYLEGKTITIGKIDLSQVVQDQQEFVFPIELTPELSNDSGITQATVTVTIRGLETKTVETSNIDIINTPEGFTADAVTQSLQVKVRGPADALDTVEGYQIRVVVDLEGQNLRQAQFPFTPKIYLDGDSRCGVVSPGSNGYIVVVNIQSQ
ncbi:CdaR family protein [Intestinimonas sp. HCP28S3_D6]|uniref:CdaR family protein n=1 Tax=Intestinimonas sp. HCP28S3_D6 TaxID=3438942 RepID=UPI003F8CD388